MALKKNLLIRSIPASTMVEIYWEGGGELPSALKGAFTNIKTAKQAIATFLDSTDREEQLLEAYKKDTPKPAVAK